MTWLKISKWGIFFDEIFKTLLTNIKTLKNYTMPLTISLSIIHVLYKILTVAKQNNSFFIYVKHKLKQFVKL